MRDKFEQQPTMLPGQIPNIHRMRDLLLPRLLSGLVNLGETHL
jgi:hypothetical protein